MGVPCLIEYRVVALLDLTGVDININDILGECCVFKEDTCEVMAIQLSSSMTCSFYINTQIEDLEVLKVRLGAMPNFKRGGFCHTVHLSIV